MTTPKNDKAALIGLMQMLGLLPKTGSGEHSHKCPKCGFIWSHEDQCINDQPAHTCQQCGKVNWMVFKDERGGVWQSCVAQQTGRRV